MSSVPLRVRFWLVILTGVSATAASFGITSSQAVSRQAWFTAFAFLALIVVVERLGVSFPSFAGGSFEASVGAPIALTAAIHFGVGLGSLLVLTGHLIDSIAARRAPLKSLTNISTLVSATAAGGAIYLALADQSTSPIGSVYNLAILIFASVLYVIISTSSVAFIVAPILGIPVRTLWRSTFRLSALETATLPAVVGLVAIAANENATAVLLLLLPLLGPQMAYRALARAQQNVRNTLESLADVVERRDGHTADHSTRVTESVRAIVTELSDIPHELTDTILAAARIHDLGKVGTKDVTLYKPGPLSDVERAEMQRHAAIGAEVVSQIAEYKLTAAIIRHHHEHWDGSGYPDGISGRDIPLGSRIIAVADAFDAMTSDRPYRSAMSPTSALNEIRRSSGTQFDPQVVEAFERVCAGRVIASSGVVESEALSVVPES